MSKNNKTYSVDIANRVLARVFRDNPYHKTPQELHDDVTAIIFEGLQVAEKRGEIIDQVRSFSGCKANSPLCVLTHTGETKGGVA